jgi:hypothetical protein
MIWYDMSLFLQEFTQWNQYKFYVSRLDTLSKMNIMKEEKSEKM